MSLTIADIVHAVGYALPGLVLWLVAAVLRATGRRAAAAEKAPRWARHYYRFVTALLFAVGTWLLAIGLGLAVAVLRR